MIDMTQFIAANSGQLNADDLMDAPRTITITKVTASPDAAEQPVSVHYEGDGGKPLKPCKTVRRIMVGVWGKDASKYVGRSMTIYRDPTVAFGGMQVGGIRVSHMSHITEPKTIALQVTRGRKAPFTVQPLKDAATSSPTDQAPDQDAALAALTEAAQQGMEALGNVWKQKWLAPHREALQLDLDRLKIIAEEKGKPTTLADAIADTPAEAKAAEIKAQLAAATDAEAVEAAAAEFELHRAAMDESAQTALEIALSQARERVAPVQGELVK